MRLRCERAAGRAGYLTVDALVGLAVATIAVSAAVGLAAHTVTRMAQARDRSTAVRIADTLYEDLSVGARPDGQHSGITDGAAWTYSAINATTEGAPPSVRKVRITVQRRFGRPLVVDAWTPAAPATASSN